MDDEPAVMTLDEWKRTQGGSKVKAEFNVRQAGEGCSEEEAKWKKMHQLKKKAEEEQQEQDEEVASFILFLSRGPWGHAFPCSVHS